MSYEETYEQQKCPRCGGAHAPTVACPTSDIVGGSSVFIFKDEKKRKAEERKKRRATTPVKHPVAKPKNKRDQSSTSLSTRKTPSKAAPLAPKKPTAKTRDEVNPTLTPSNPSDDCTVSTEPGVRVKTIGQDSLVFETKSGRTVTVEPPCTDSIVKTLPKRP